MDLRYKVGVADPFEDLAVGECTVWALSRENERVGWGLYFLANRSDNGKPEIFRVPIIVGGGFTESGPCGRSWGFTKIAAGTWQVSPSIHFPGVWHETPRIVGVPDGEPWQ
jgi:hypothetical protein